MKIITLLLLILSWPVTALAQDEDAATGTRIGVVQIQASTTTVSVPGCDATSTHWSVRRST